MTLHAAHDKAGSAAAWGRGFTMGHMDKLVGTIQPFQTEQIHAEGAAYEQAKAALEAQVPEGWRLLSILNER